MHHPYGLHLHHELVLRQRRILRPQPPQAFRRAELLDVDIFKEVFEISVAFRRITYGKRSNRTRAFCVDIAKKSAFNFIVHGRAEKSRVQILLNKRPGWRRLVQGVLATRRSVRSFERFRRQVQIGERRFARLPKAFLVPFGHVVIVSCFRHPRSLENETRSKQ